MQDEENPLGNAHERLDRIEERIDRITQHRRQFQQDSQRLRHQLMVGELQLSKIAVRTDKIDETLARITVKLERLKRSLNPNFLAPE